MAAVGVHISRVINTTHAESYIWLLARSVVINVHLCFPRHLKEIH